MNSFIRKTVTTTLGPIGTIGGYRRVGIEVFNRGPSALTSFQIWGSTVSRQGVDLGGEILLPSWEVIASLSSDFSSPSVAIPVTSDGTNPTSLASGTSWQCTLDLANLAEIEIKATSEGTSDIIILVGS